MKIIHIIYFSFLMLLPAFAQPDTILIHQTESVYHTEEVYSAELPEEEIQTQTARQHHTQYDFYILLVLLGSLAMITTGFRKDIQSIAQSVWNINRLFQWYRIIRNQSYLFLWLLNLLFLFMSTISLYAWFSGNITSDFGAIPIQWLPLAIYILLYVGLSFIISFILAWLIGKSELAYIDLSFRLAINALSVYILFIPFVLILLSPSDIQQFSIIAFVFLLSLIVLWQEILSVRILVIERLNIASFHFFLYICTLKIIPVIIGYKVVTTFIY